MLLLRFDVWGTCMRGSSQSSIQHFNMLSILSPVIVYCVWKHAAHDSLQAVDNASVMAVLGLS